MPWDTKIASALFPFPIYCDTILKQNLSHSEKITGMVDNQFPNACSKEEFAGFRLFLPLAVVWTDLSATDMALKWGLYKPGIAALYAEDRTKIGEHIKVEAKNK